MEEFKPVKEGKVREIYDIGSGLIMYATDRISAFDVILKNKVEGKGKVLTQMSRFWFDLTKDIIPNHMISTDTNDMPEFFRAPEFEGHVNHGIRLEELSGERHSLRHCAARRPSRMRQAAGARLYTFHEGGDR